MKYRVVKKETIKQEYDHWIIEKRSFWTFGLWEYVTSTIHEQVARDILKRLRSGEPYETRTVIE